VGLVSSTARETDFVPAGTVREPGQRLADALSWRVSQRQWVAEETEDEDEDADDEWGEWALRAHSPIDAATVAERLPQGLMPWVRRRTEQAVELFDESVAQGLRSLRRPAG
jgi:hypothetical protein